MDLQSFFGYGFTFYVFVYLQYPKYFAGKDLQRYGLLQVIGVEQKQNIKVMNREMLK